MKTGWYNNNTEFWTVTPLHDGYRQSFCLGAVPIYQGYQIIMIVCSSNCKIENFRNNPVLNYEIASTNKAPSFKMLPLAIDKLKEIEEAIAEKETRKRYTIRIDGLDNLRLRVYEKALKKYNCGYKESRVMSHCVRGMHTLQKTFLQKPLTN